MRLEIDVLLTESELTRQFLAALEQRYLAEKFFYWLPLSVEAWLNLCAGAQPYKNYARSYELVSQRAADLARCLDHRQIELVSLGAGQGDKELLLLRALRNAAKQVRYRPVDASQALLETACRGAMEAGISTRGLKADLADSQTFSELARSAAEPRLYAVLGNSLGVIEPSEFLRSLARLARRQDYVLLDGEIFSPDATLPGYDNPVNRRFAFAPLASVGLEEGRDGALVFQYEKGNLEGFHLVGKYFRAARPLRVPVAGQWVELRPDEKIAMNSSYKYSPEAFGKLLSQAGDFRPLREYVSDDGSFQMLLAAPAEKGTA